MAENKIDIQLNLPNLPEIKDNLTSFLGDLNTSLTDTTSKLSDMTQGSLSGFRDTLEITSSLLKVLSLDSTSVSNDVSSGLNGSLTTAISLNEELKKATSLKVEQLTDVGLQPNHMYNDGGSVEAPKKDSSKKDEKYDENDPDQWEKHHKQSEGAKEFEGYVREGVTPLIGMVKSVTNTTLKIVGLLTDNVLDTHILTPGGELDKTNKSLDESAGNKVSLKVGEIAGDVLTDVLTAKMATAVKVGGAAIPYVAANIGSSKEYLDKYHEGDYGGLGRSILQTNLTTFGMGKVDKFVESKMENELVQLIPGVVEKSTEKFLIEEYQLDKKADARIDNFLHIVPKNESDERKSIESSNNNPTPAELRKYNAVMIGGEIYYYPGPEIPLQNKRKPKRISKHKKKPIPKLEVRTIPLREEPVRPSGESLTPILLNPTEKPQSSKEIHTLQEIEDQKLKILEQSEQKQSLLEQGAQSVRQELTKNSLAEMQNLVDQGLGSITSKWILHFGQQHTVAGKALASITQTTFSSMKSMGTSYLEKMATKLFVDETENASTLTNTAIHTTSSATITAGESAKKTSFLATAGVVVSSIATTIASYVAGAASAVASAAAWVASNLAIAGSAIFSAVTSVIQWISEMIPFPFSLAVIPAGVAAIYGIYAGVKKLFKFKDGGITKNAQMFNFGDNGEHTGVFGENRSSSGEAFIPLEKLPDVVGRMVVTPQGSLDHEPIVQAINGLHSKFDDLHEATMKRPQPHILDTYGTLLSATKQKTLVDSRVLG